jgi:hypothetical protein
VGVVCIAPVQGLRGMQAHAASIPSVETVSTDPGNENPCHSQPLKQLESVGCHLA